MLLNNQLQDLLQTEVDRKEFLAYLGATLLAVVGVSGLINILTQSPTKRTAPHDSLPSGTYGSSVYGGHR